MKQRVVGEGFQFSEGPSKAEDGTIYVAEMGSHFIGKIGADGKRELFATLEGGPGATAVGPDGGIYITNNGGLAFKDGRASGGATAGNSGGRIERIDKDGDVTVVCSEFEGEQLSAPNDLVFDQFGNLYFTDPQHGLSDFYGGRPEWPVGHVYFTTTDGSTLKRVATGYDLSNGIAISEDGKTLYVCESLTFKVWAHEILAPGELSERRLFGQLPDGHMPDGCCVDSAGNLICAAVGSAALVVFNSEGRMLSRIPTEDTDVTNATFAGDDWSTLLFTEGYLGRVSAFDWPWPGMVPFPARSWTAAGRKIGGSNV